VAAGVACLGAAAAGAVAVAMREVDVDPVLASLALAPVAVLGLLFVLTCSKPSPRPACHARRCGVGGRCPHCGRYQDPLLAAMDFALEDDTPPHPRR
jgi:hypothetical protein